MKKLPIGISDFKELVEDNRFYYIDKSDLITDIMDNGAKVILLPRPRRFGKTLNLSMLNYFFDIEEDSRELFQGLSVYDNQAIMNHANKYPIIYISFKDVKEESFEKSKNKIYSLIRGEFAKHEKSIAKVIDSISSEDRDNYFKIIKREAQQEDYENGFKLLSKLLWVQCLKITIDTYLKGC